MNRFPRIRIASLLALALIFVVGCAGSPGTPTQPAPSTPTPAAAPAPVPQAKTPADLLADLYAKAKVEGEVSWYTGMGLDAADGVMADFKAKYPGIVVNLTRKTGQQILAQYTLEKESKIRNADVVEYPGLAPILTDFIPKKWIAQYTPIEGPNYRADLTIPGYAYPVFVYTSGVLYNVAKVTAEEINMLRDYRNWTDPRWKGRAAMVAPAGGSTARNIMMMWRNPSLGEPWMTLMAKNVDPVLFTSITPAGERVAAGEYDVAFNINEVIPHRQFNAGIRNTAYVYQNEWTSATPMMTVIDADARNPNAARLFVEWMLGEDGQLAIQKHVNALSSRTGINRAPSTAPWFEWPKNIVSTETMSSYEQDAKDLNASVEAFSRIFKWAR